MTSVLSDSISFEFSNDTIKAKKTKNKLNYNKNDFIPEKTVPGTELYFEILKAKKKRIRSTVLKIKKSRNYLSTHNQQLNADRESFLNCIAFEEKTTLINVANSLSQKSEFCYSLSPTDTNNASIAIDHAHIKLMTL